jgi:fibronectin type 3 domain-containing protein
LGESAETVYQDREFRFDHTYFYRVRAVFKQGSQSAETEDSTSVGFTPRDTFPPGAPSGLTGIYTAGRVELVWNSNSESDLAGYNVYRRADSEAPQRINSDLLGTPTFHDGSAEAGHTYSYWITAVDVASNESSRSESVEVVTR